MPKSFLPLFKTLLGIAVSISSITFMSSSASAATLRMINALQGLAVQNNSSSQGSCSRSLSGFTMSLSCNQSFNVNTSFGVSTAGGFSWRDIFQEFQFIGDRGRRYRISFNLSGSVSASAKGAGLASSVAASGLRPRNGSPSTFINLAGPIAWTSSDWKWHSSSSWFDFNGGSTQNFRVGAQTYGNVQAFGLGYAYASASTSFTSTATIRDIGSSWGRSASFPTIPEDDFEGIPEDDFEGIPEDDFEGIPEDDFDSIPEDNITTSVPEPTIMAGLALVGAMLLASKRSRFAKQHPEEAENVTDTTAVEVQ